MKLSQTQSLVRTAIMIAIIIILGMFPGIPLGFIPIPLVLQNASIMLAGSILGSKYGTVAITIFMVLVLVGFPILSGGRGGAVVFIGPTCGYLLGFFLTPFLIGFFLEHTPAEHYWWLELSIVIMVGVFLVDFVGTLGLMIQSHTPFWTALVSNLAFIPGDIIKACLVTIVARRIRAIFHIKLAA